MYPEIYGHWLSLSKHSYDDSTGIIEKWGWYIETPDLLPT